MHGEKILSLIVAKSYNIIVLYIFKYRHCRTTVESAHKNFARVKFLNKHILFVYFDKNKYT